MREDDVLHVCLVLAKNDFTIPLPPGTIRRETEQGPDLPNISGKT